MKGRDADGRLQAATLTFTLGHIDKSMLLIPEFRSRGGIDSLWDELTPLYKAAKARGETTNPKSHVVVFPYPDGERLLFNSNEILGVDPTIPGSIEAAYEKGRRFVDEMVAIFRRDHPAFARCEVLQISSRLGVREGRRVVGDYILNEDDCLAAAKFPDMVAACAYEIDIHDPDGGETRIVKIPDPGFYHIPYRSLVARDADNLLLASRCISGTHEAHSSYRVMSGVTAIGEAAGVAAALAARHTGGEVRAVPASAIRHVLREQIQFVEGDTTPFPA
jgi:FAD dependent oxidoreductase